MSSKFVELDAGLLCDADYVDRLGQMGLTSMDAIFTFEGGRNLSKENLADFRSRRRFALGDTTAYLKRYDCPPRAVQLRNWIAHRRRAAMAQFDHQPSIDLAKAGIQTPRTIAYGWQWGGLFEKRSFIITEGLEGAEALERRPPACFHDVSPRAHVQERRNFIDALADFARRFHETGYRHRDFYLAHIFQSDNGRFHLIDLHRAFQPRWLAERFRVKDIAQLHYSASGPIFSCTDRLRFYRRYAGTDRLSRKDRRFLRRVRARAWRMADHDIRHGRQVPFAM